MMLHRARVGAGVASMNVHVKPQVRMTVDEFLAWEPGDGRKWELADGEPRAMAPAKPTHAFLQNELARLTGNHLLAQGSIYRTTRLHRSS